MIRFFKVLVFLFLTATSICSAQINDEFVDGEIYIKLKPEFFRQGVVKTSSNVDFRLEIPGINDVIQNSGTEIKEASAPFYNSKNENISNIYRLKIADGVAIEKVIKALKEAATIDYAERVRRRRIISTPSDTLYPSQWHLDQIKAPQAWDVNPGTQDIIVAVVDNAIQVNHQDLAANMVAGRDVSNNDADPSPPDASFSHGTHVAGIVAAVNNNITGIASAGNNRVKVMPIKATNDASYNAYIDNGYEGIIWAVANGADIISLSWGGSGFSQTEQDIIDDAYANGVLVLAAAGNEDSNVQQYPAAYNHVIAVASLDDDDSRSSFSSYGAYVDISAPGRGILSTIPFNEYASFNGTSMATPLVASCAGYLLSCFPTLSADSIALILNHTADDISAANPTLSGSLGSGRVNLLKAIACKGENLFAESPTVSPLNYFCAGDSALLDIASVSTETYEWFYNGLSFSNSKNEYAKNEGQYQLVRTLGSCVVPSEAINIIHNSAFTAAPSAVDLDLSYCDAANNFAVATIPPCDSYGPESFSYSGPTIGFDGYLQSDNYPTATVSGIGGLIDSITVSITWQKMDGGSHTYCGSPDLGGTPFNEEVAFSIVSPDGIRVALVNKSDYGRGTATSGIITTVFTVNGLALVGDPIPVSGSFKAAGDMSVYENQIPQGIWTLEASDDSTIDPLCVMGFSVTIKTKEPTVPAEIIWYSDLAQANLLESNDSLEVNTSIVGLSTYYAVAQCEGLCPSEPQEVEVNVRPVPQLFAFSRDVVTLTNAQIQEILTAQSADCSTSSSNLYTIFGQNAQGNPFSYQISNQAPLVSPVSICGEKDYVVFGSGCNGTISWSNGGTGQGIVLSNQSTALNLTATCNQSWDCAPLVNIPFDFTEPISPLVLSGLIDQNTGQSFYGTTINSTHFLKENSTINYSAPQSILLQPGFESVPSAVFMAEIGDCVSP